MCQEQMGLKQEKYFLILETILALHGMKLSITLTPIPKLWQTKSKTGFSNFKKSTKKTSSHR